MERYPSHKQRTAKEGVKSMNGDLLILRFPHLLIILQMLLWVLTQSNMNTVRENYNIVFNHPYS